MLTGRPLFNFQLKAWVATHSCVGSSISAKMNNFYTKSTGPLQLKLFLRPDKSKLKLMFSRLCQCDGKVENSIQQ